MTEKDVFRVNNFDLIRLLAALEVAVHHTLYHFELKDNWLFHGTSWLPGVPIFFFVSGFLISKSYENNSRISEYARNRALRIYPALIVCTLLAVASAFATGYLAKQPWTPAHLVAWIASQITIFQFYGPSFMRDFGSGVLNGSLWTVTVELQFYILIPLIYWMLARIAKGGRRLNAALIAVIVAFVAPNVVFQHFNETRPEAFAVKLAHVSFMPWLYMFLLGMLAQKNFLRIHRFVAGRAVPILCAYGLIAFAAVRFLGLPTGNEIHPILFPLLAVTVLSVAYTKPSLSDRILHKNDISYGVYIYHMPVINVMMYEGLVSGSCAVMVLACTIAAATCSWFFLERIAIRKKKRPLMTLSPAGPTPEPRP